MDSCFNVGHSWAHCPPAPAASIILAPVHQLTIHMHVLLMWFLFASRAGAGASVHQRVSGSTQRNLCSRVSTSPRGLVVHSPTSLHALRQDRSSTGASTSSSVIPAVAYQQRQAQLLQRRGTAARHYQQMRSGSITASATSVDVGYASSAPVSEDGLFQFACPICHQTTFSLNSQPKA